MQSSSSIRPLSCIAIERDCGATFWKHYATSNLTYIKRLGRQFEEIFFRHLHRQALTTANRREERQLITVSHFEVNWRIFMIHCKQQGSSKPAQLGKSRQ